MESASPMVDDEGSKVVLTFDATTAARLRACAAWRNVSVEEVAQAYVEDWIDIDYPNSHGRLTRRGINRDGPIGLCERTRELTSRNWEAELKAKGL